MDGFKDYVSHYFIYYFYLYNKYLRSENTNNYIFMHHLYEIMTRVIAHVLVMIFSGVKRGVFGK